MKEEELNGFNILLVEDNKAHMIRVIEPNLGRNEIR